MATSGTEKCYSKTADAVVTNKRAVLNGVTCAIANVTSVKCVKSPQLAPATLTLVFFGVLLITAALVLQTSSLAVIGFVLLVVTFFLGFFKKPLYTMILGTSGGEIHAMESENLPSIKSIIDAVSLAIVERT